MVNFDLNFGRYVCFNLGLLESSHCFERKQKRNQSVGQSYVQSVNGLVSKQAS